jgi:hypothetical protein
MNWPQPVSSSLNAAWNFANGQQRRTCRWDNRDEQAILHNDMALVDLVPTRA